MHDIGDLILEAVNNSLEAQAESVEISINRENKRYFISVTDDGVFNFSLYFFEKGYSTKGTCRGNGLWIIKSMAPDAKIERAKGKTRLTFSILDDGSLEKIEDVLFPVFQKDKRICVHYRENDREVFSLDKAELNVEDIPFTAESIASFKALVCKKKGVC